MRFTLYLTPLVAVLTFAPATAAQPLADPGPVCAGLTDTPAFGGRLERHLAATEEALAPLRAVEGPRTVANTVVPYKAAESELKNAGRLAALALNAHPEAGFRAYAQAWAGRIAEREAALGGDPAVYEALAA